MSTQKDTEQKRDEALDDSFPASDPPANSGITGAGSPAKPSEHKEDEIPTGLPTSDRHATETAHQSEDNAGAPTER